MNKSSLRRIMLIAALAGPFTAHALFNQSLISGSWQPPLKIDPGTGLSPIPTPTPTPAPAPQPTPPPATPAQELPMAPAVYLKTKTTRGITLEFDDKTDLEDGFILYRQQDGGEWRELGRFGAIENRTASRFIVDDRERGFRLLESFEGRELPVEITAAEGIGSLAITNREREIGHDTSYCYRLLPFNSHGETEPVTPLCTRTNRDLKASDGRHNVSLNPGHAANGGANIPVDVRDYDGAVLVKDAAGLVGELREDWAGTRLIYVDDRASIDLSLYTSFKDSETRKTRNIPGFPSLELKSGLTLMSGRGGLNPGALIFSNKLEQYALFKVTGNNVRVVGLRFRGPSASSSPDQKKTNGLYFNVADILDEISPQVPVSFRVTASEFYRWTSAGIYFHNSERAFSDGTRILDKDIADRVLIDNNYFHHNRRQNAGYGVVIKGAAYFQIEKNTFDENRHAIASTGGRDYIVEGYGPEHGYKAYLNLVLPGHVTQCQAGCVISYLTHHFDVHGSENKYESLPFTDGLGYYDGWAGEYFDIAHNSFLIASGNTPSPESEGGRAFNVRGTPSDSAYFTRNILPNTRRRASAWVNDESDRDNVFVKRNRLLLDGRQRIGVGDFDGDGIDDVFLATGAAWYYSSGARAEWRFLNKSTFRIDELVLADHDGDGITDVLRLRRDRWLISRGGTERWTRNGLGDIDYSSIEANVGTEVIGDFTGDGAIDQLWFDFDGDRHFHVNGRKHSRQKM